MKIHTKLILKAKDVSIITGYKLRHSQRIMQQLRKKLKKGPDEYISVSEFCKHKGLNKDEVNDKVN